MKQTEGEIRSLLSVHINVTILRKKRRYCPADVWRDVREYSEYIRSPSNATVHETEMVSQSERR